MVGLKLNRGAIHSTMEQSSQHPIVGTSYPALHSRGDLPHFLRGMVRLELLVQASQMVHSLSRISNQQSALTSNHQ